MVEGIAHVGRKMQDICGDNDVKLSGCHALFERIALDIECLKANKRIAVKSLLCAIDNRGGDIAEQIVGTRRRQKRKQVRGKAAGSGTELQDAQRLIRWLPTDPFGDRLACDAIVDARCRSAVIEMLDGTAVLQSEQILWIQFPSQ